MNKFKGTRSLLNLFGDDFTFSIKFFQRLLYAGKSLLTTNRCCENKCFFDSGKSFQPIFYLQKEMELVDEQIYLIKNVYFKVHELLMSHHKYSCFTFLFYFIMKHTCTISQLL